MKVRALHEAGANLGASNDDNETPLTKACTFNPQPSTPNPQFETRNPHPKRCTLNLKSTKP